MQEWVVQVVENHLVLFIVWCDLDKIEVQIKLSQVEGDGGWLGLIQLFQKLEGLQCKNLLVLGLMQRVDLGCLTCEVRIEVRTKQGQEKVRMWRWIN